MVLSARGSWRSPERAEPHVLREFARVLAPGGSQEPMDLLRKFLGRDPSSEAFFAEIELADDARPAKPRQLYRWTDDQNVVYWTDNPESVPDQFRARLKKVQLH